MKNSKLTLVLVIALTGFVPQIASSQANPGAKVETITSNTAQPATKTTARKATAPIQLAADAPPLMSSSRATPCGVLRDDFCNSLGVGPKSGI